MQGVIGYALLVVALLIIGVALIRLRRTGYRPGVSKSVSPMLLAASGCSAAAAVVLFTS